MDKDWATLGGVFVTLGLGIYNFYNAQRSARRTSIVESVTAQRLKWGAEIQDLIGSFCGATHYLRFSVVKGSEEERKKIEEIEQLRHRIPLNLCERTDLERHVQDCVKYIASMSSERLAASDDEFRAKAASDKQFCDKLDELVSTTQDLLQNNWEVIWSEAQKGDYAPRLGAATQDRATDTSDQSKTNRPIA